MKPLVLLVDLPRPYVSWIKYYMNVLPAIGLFLYHLKISDDIWFSDVFRGYIKRQVIWNKFNMHFINTSYVPVGNDMFKVNNRNSRWRCWKCPKLPIKTPERCVFKDNFEQFKYPDLLFPLLTLTKYFGRSSNKWLMPFKLHTSRYK